MMMLPKDEMPPQMGVEMTHGEDIRRREARINNENLESSRILSASVPPLPTVQSFLPSHALKVRGASLFMTFEDISRKVVEATSNPSLECVPPLRHMANVSPAGDAGFSPLI